MERQKIFGGKRAVLADLLMKHRMLRPCEGCCSGCFAVEVRVWGGRGGGGACVPRNGFLSSER